MAFMNQERKATIAKAVKPILKKYGVKGSLAVRHYSTLVLNLKSGPLDIIGNYNETTAKRNGGFREGSPVKDYLQVNEYWIHEHYSGKVRDFLTEVKTAMNVGNHDNSDASIDYFDVGWYVNINVGKWNKPYVKE
jgi:hypothetical protein